jgi:hypothetical protein
MRIYFIATVGKALIIGMNRIHRELLPSMGSATVAGNHNWTIEFTLST